MTKLERALKAAEQLPAEMQERIADNLLHYVDRYLALRDDVALGVAQLDRGEWVDADFSINRLIGFLHS
jgi:hypothetical protein